MAATNPLSADYAAVTVDVNGKAIPANSVLRYEFLIEKLDGTPVRTLTDATFEAGVQKTAIPQDLPIGSYRMAGRTVTSVGTGPYGPKADFEVTAGLPAPPSFSLA